MNSAIEGNLAQDAAQLGYTARLIESSARRIAKSMTALRRKRFGEAIDALWSGSARSPRYRSASPSFTGSLANNWLELQYGWKPLLMDIDGAMRSLASFYQLGEHITRTVSASAKKETILRAPIMDDAIHLTTVGSSETRTTTRVRIMLRYQIDSRLKAFLAQTGFTNPVNLIWEVLPYSFVLDWFLPIGNWLQTLSSFDGLVFVDGCKTSFTRQNYIGVVNYTGTYAPYSPWQDISVYGSYARERIVLNRDKLTSFPSPNKPAFKSPWSTTHALNALALAKAAFGR
jgi:hypothetical protein